MKACWLAAILSMSMSISGCGYHTLYGDAANVAAQPHYHVTLVHAKVADAVANDEVVSGVRSVLAKDGALAAGAGYPRIEVEVLRADEISEGITAVRPAPNEARIPRARGSQVGIVARAWVVREPEAARELDTGDIRAFDLVESPSPDCHGSQVSCGSSGGLIAETMRHDDALRATARRVGEKLGARILGHPVARDESPSELW